MIEFFSIYYTIKLEKLLTYKSMLHWRVWDCWQERYHAKCPPPVVLPAPAGVAPVVSSESSPGLSPEAVLGSHSVDPSPPRTPTHTVASSPSPSPFPSWEASVHLEAKEIRYIYVCNLK